MRRHEAGDVIGLDGDLAELLSHLEVPRVEELMAEGRAFPQAKDQAFSEILAAFSATTGCGAAARGASEELDLTAGRREDAALLAISAIILGYRAEAEFTEMLANLAGDLRRDGTLDSESTVESLVRNARALDPTAVREHLSARYADLGADLDLGDFECFVELFVAAHPEVPDGPVVDYPAGSLLALLAASESPVAIPNESNLRADSPGLPVRVEIHQLRGAGWAYATNQTGWDVSQKSSIECMQSFTLLSPDTTAALPLFFDSAGTRRIDVYEGRMDRVAWSRVVTTGDGGAEKLVGCGGPRGD